MKTKDNNSDVYSTPYTQHPCILIYDDDPEVLFLCNEILAKSQYHVKTLLRCDNVIKDIASIQPDIILMDLWIPQMGGEKAITTIKSSQGIQDTPIIIFSADLEIEKICEKAKADDYIRKPFDIANFKETIEKVLLKAQQCPVRLPQISYKT